MYTFRSQQQSRQLALHEHRGVVSVGQNNETFAGVWPFEAQHVYAPVAVIGRLMEHHSVGPGLRNKHT